MAERSTQRVLEAYEAQMLRALNDLRQNFQLLAFASAQQGPVDALHALHERGLLLPTVIGSTRVVDAEGRTLASNGPGNAENRLDTAVLQRAKNTSEFVIGPPVRQAGDSEPTVDIAMRLGPPGEPLHRLVVYRTPVSYFVSDYDEGRMGERGLLEVVGTDGVIRVRRTGTTLTYGQRLKDPSIVQGIGETPIAVHVRASPIDGERRYNAARKLYGVPLAVVVGLSESEQLQSSRTEARRLWMQTGWATAALIAVTAALTWLSWRIAVLRRREAAARVEHAKQVEYLAYHDGLTDLPNRSFFTRTLVQQMAAAQRTERDLALLFLDLDGFKKINDIHGHHAGDELLRQVAERLQTCVRGSDIVARLGGDEFVVLLPEPQSEAEVAQVAQRIISAVAAPFMLMGHESRVTASVGVCLYPRDGEDEEALTRNADAAMYCAKERGKNNVQFYSATLTTTSLERQALDVSLRQALLSEQFQLHYQLRRDTRTGTVTGTEALLRWRHPDLGLVMPMQFLRAAEDSGLIVPLGAWVLQRACADNMRWIAQGAPARAVAVNLTQRQFFEPGLVGQVSAALTASAMPARLLELEISEATLMHDVPKAMEVLTRLRELGVRTAIDDFGTVYSSLASLPQFPIDILKIDRNFIREIVHKESDRQLARAIVSMGQSLGLSVVAQGVEDEAQMMELQAQSCTEMQGFYFNHPLPAESIAALLLRPAQAAEPAQAEGTDGTPSAQQP